MALRPQSVAGRLVRAWQSSKLFGAVVMLAIVIPATLSSTAFIVLMNVLMIALGSEVGRAARFASRRGGEAMAMVALLMFVGGMFSLGMIRWSQEYGVSTLLLLAAGTFLNDAGAQGIGKLFANRLWAFSHKPMPEEQEDPTNMGLSLLHLARWCARGLAGHPFKRISPGKTWVGLVGGLAVGWIAGAGALWWLDATWDYPLSYGIALVVITPPLAVVGDFIESAAKRSLGIKDMSHVLGAHGGLSDRLDAISMTAIGAAILMLLF